VALLINNLGSTSDLEINIVALEAIRFLGNSAVLVIDSVFAVLSLRTVIDP